MKILAQLARPGFEQQAQVLRQDILRICGERNLDSECVVAALADVAATIAAILDKRDDRRLLNERLDAFCERATVTYERLRDAHDGTGCTT